MRGRRFGSPLQTSLGSTVDRWQVRAEYGRLCRRGPNGTFQMNAEAADQSAPSAARIAALNTSIGGAPTIAV